MKITKLDINSNIKCNICFRPGIADYKVKLGQTIIYVCDNEDMRTVYETIDNLKEVN